VTAQIGAKKSGTITIISRIFADTLPQPLEHTLKINWKVDRVSKTAQEVLNELGTKLKTETD
jgi:hypothetical protein